MNTIHFIHASALWALALLIFIVVFYILRMPRLRLRVSALHHMRRLQLGSDRRQRRLRTLLSMALLCLVLLLLAFSAARPLITSGNLDQKQIVLVMDISASMQTYEPDGDATRFVLAREKAKAIVRRMEYGDTMLVIAAGHEARVVQQFEKERRTLYRVLDALQPESGAARLAPALELVREVTRPLPEATVVLITDGADAPENGAYSNILAKAEMVVVGNITGNVGIVSFSSRRNLDSERDFSSVMVLSNTFEVPQLVSVRLSIGETIVDAREITLAPGTEHTESFEGTRLVGGPLTAELRLLDTQVRDGLALDNVAYEWIPKPVRLKVLVVAPKEELDGYLDAAMSANIGVQGYRVTPDNYSARYDVDAMIFYNWLPQDLPDINLIFVNTHGNTPGVSISGGPVLQPLMNTWDRTHPLMNYIGLENLLLEEALSVSGADWLEPVARTVQSPLILAGENGRQKIVFVAFDPKKSDFPFRLAFPALLSNALLWFRSGDAARPVTQIRPGEPFKISIADDARDQIKDVTVTDPAGRKQRLALSGGQAVYLNTAACGTYTISLADRQLGFGVNLADSAESAIACREIFRNARADHTADEGQSPPVERELWFLLNWIALLLICIETWLFHQKILF